MNETDAPAHMRGLIHARGIQEAAALAGEMVESEVVEDMILAAYDAGRLAGIEQSRKLQASGVSVEEYHR